MPLILNIDTATDHAGVCISRDEEILATAENKDQKQHGAFIQPAIQELFVNAALPISAIDAISVTAGPGSYTGLRVGLSTAKGLCYSLNKPLILLNTLDVMAKAALNEKAALYPDEHDFLLCPMIDARRMEVFTALYNNLLQHVLQPETQILHTESLAPYLEKNIIYFSGSGSIKWKNIVHHPHAFFLHTNYSATDMVSLSLEAFKLKTFADMAYSEPFYLKEFYSTQKKQ